MILKYILLFISFIELIIIVIFTIYNNNNKKRYNSILINENDEIIPNIEGSIIKFINDVNEVIDDINKTTIYTTTVETDSAPIKSPNIGQFITNVSNDNSVLEQIKTNLKTSENSITGISSIANDIAGEAASLKSKINYITTEVKSIVAENN